MEDSKNQISLYRLFLEFLKIGATSFGGFMALISMVEKQFVEKTKLIKSDELLDIVSVASMLPGPMAVNVVAYLGYKLKGIKGSMISMFAVLLPTFILIIIASHLYFKYGNLPQVNSIFMGIMPAVCAIILSVALNMAKKNLTDIKLGVICVLAALIYIVIGGFFITLLIIVSTGIVGWLIYRNTIMDITPNKSNRKAHSFFQIFFTNRLFFTSILVVTLLILLAPALYDIQNLNLLLHRDLYITFGGVSITLFGGGYVFIPVLQDLVVDQLHWVTAKEFIDGIALGQVTPGPIMISAAFIGYKLAGLTGAIISTLAIFLPPALLMIIVSSFIENIKESKALNAAFKGIRAAVIGMIFAASWVIGKSIGLEFIPIGIMILAFILTYWFKVNVAYLIPLAGLMGFLLF